MNDLDDDIVEAFHSACRCFQLQGPYVLQAFVNALSVTNHLFASNGTAAHAAAQVFSAFTSHYPPAFGLDPVKKIVGIQYMRRILKMNKSYRSEEEKEKVYEQLCDNWACSNGILGEGEELCLHTSLCITQPLGLLLLCDLYRCRPHDLLNYFIEELLLQIQGFTIDGQAIQFLIHYASSLYPIKNN